MNGMRRRAFLKLAGRVVEDTAGRLRVVQEPLGDG